MARNFNLLKDSESKLYLKYLAPSIFGMIMLSGYVFVDALCVGRALGGVGLAALNVSTPTISLMYATGFLFATGSATIYSIFKGKNQDENARKMYTFGFISALVMGIIYCILGILFVDKIAYFLGATDNTIEMTKQYMLTILSFAPFFVLDIFMNVFARNDKAPHISMLATIACCSLNIVLDVLFVFGFNLGMFGAAIATAISTVVSFIITFSYSLSKKSGLKLKRFIPKLNDFLRIVTNGVSSFISEMSVGVVTIAFNRVILSHIGEIGVSSYGIIANINLIFFSIFMGNAQAMQPLVSINYGANEYKRTFNFFKLGVTFAMIVGVVFTSTSVFLSYQLSSLFITDPEIIKVTASALKIYGLAYLIMGINLLFDAFFYSVEKPKFAVSISLSRALVIVLSMLFILSNVFGSIGIWMTVPVTEVFTLCIGLTLFVKYKHNQLSLSLEN
ncbi:UNVERIFIED_ORG: MATE family efflux transporter [Clostridium botulinum]|uniref:MATE family efflux transporter n=1 Tax=Clostridium botulinum TaxID=1491 RepID=UPI000381F035|nr:MATE family efflux transporter [Clostridium botulinum]KIL08633.1 multidrug transporter MATE [Clostridium botulinum]MBN1034224.1 MATE family efflux transporter [Clostridium botulinum]MBY6931504.1 MATE family efflux transporter [Clostridium botulinum]MBY6934901.1 MATE family efflux transporter [Clostridium botulinum]NFE75387.1 MATE family efflux transporter [Clostridium botulinum]